ncbi:MAG: septation protein SepH [Actinomycetales bacterium]
MNLRFVAREADSIILESDQGERFQVPIDDSMRDALKNNPRVSGADFSPKLVQDLIRAGHSVDEVATQVGQDVDAIRPFAVPILDELRYVLEAALNTEVSDGASMMRFQDLISRSDPTATFSVLKTEGTWHVHANGQEPMSWKFDPRSRSLEPTNKAAQNASKQQSRRDVTSPVIHESIPTEVQMEPESSAPDSPEDSESSGRNASVHSLVEELRTRRKQADLRPATAKGRASLPSWDEIVLGTTNSESDSD